MNRPDRALLTALCLALTGLPALAQQQPPQNPTSPTPAAASAPPAAAAPGSVLTASERGMDCKGMAGRMQIRILEVRGGGPKARGSSTAMGIQSALAPLFGGTTRGADTDADAARDIAKLREMNAILIGRKCPHYDLNAELAKPHDGPSPRLVRMPDAQVPVKPPAKPGAKSAPRRPAAATATRTPPRQQPVR